MSENEKTTLEDLFELVGVRDFERWLFYFIQDNECPSLTLNTLHDLVQQKLEEER